MRSVKTEIVNPPTAIPVTPPGLRPPLLLDYADAVLAIEEVDEPLVVERSGRDGELYCVVTVESAAKLVRGGELDVDELLVVEKLSVVVVNATAFVAVLRVRRDQQESPLRRCSTADVVRVRLAVGVV